MLPFAPSQLSIECAIMRRYVSLRSLSADSDRCYLRIRGFVAVDSAVADTGKRWAGAGQVMEVVCRIRKIEGLSFFGAAEDS